MKQLETMEPPRAGRRLGYRLGYQNRVTARYLWSHHGQNQLEIGLQSWPGNVNLCQMVAYRCPPIIYLKQHAQTNQINYLKLRFFKKPGESRAKSVDQDAKKVYPSINPLRSLQSLSCPSTSPPTLGGKPKIRSLSCLETCKIVVIPT